MQVIPVTRNELALDTDDWGRLRMLMDDFSTVCNSQYCETCPLTYFCDKYCSPANYLRYLYEFLDDYPKERK